MPCVVAVIKTMSCYVGRKRYETTKTAIIIKLLIAINLITKRGENEFRPNSAINTDS